MSDRWNQNEVITSPHERYDTLRYVSEEMVCPYLPDLFARSEAYLVDHLNGASYSRLMARGFRRSGRVIYRPQCRDCQECRQLRVRIDEFTATRNMARVRRINKDVRVTVGRPSITDEKFTMFVRYLDAQHDDTMSRNREPFKDFLYESPTDTFEFCYHLGERLVGVAIADRLPDGLSSVYMFFDPDQSHRSLGTFSVLWEIDFCRREKLPYYYLGYYVADSATMAYKSRFRPNEVLVGDDRWIRFQK